MVPVRRVSLPLGALYSLRYFIVTLNIIIRNDCCVFTWVLSSQEEHALELQLVPELIPLASVSM